MARQLDKYANMASAKLAISDGAVASAEVLTGISLGQGRGILIDQIDYYMNDVEANLSAAKTVKFGWGVSSSEVLSEIDIDSKSIIHFTESHFDDHGTAGNAVLLKYPYSYQFFPPLIVAAPRIYLLAWASSSSGANSQEAYSRIYFRYVDLSSQEYLEIAESFVLVG